MAMETVTNYKCDRCGRSEIRDRVQVLTLTVRERNDNVPGQGKSKISQHVCAQHCLRKIIEAMAPVGRAGQYDRKAAAERRQAATKPATNPSTPTPATTTATATAPTTRKAGRKTPGGASKRPVPSGGTSGAFNDVSPLVREVRAITRKPSGGWAKGHNFRTEQKMIEEAQEREASKINSRPKGK